jgi:magnesium-transporting ATPase (P-type)
MRMRSLPASQIIQLGLTAMLSAIPPALPATFTLVAALGAKHHTLRGVLLTRLSALHGNDDHQCAICRQDRHAYRK